jgi:hypothetical protein
VGQALVSGTSCIFLPGTFNGRLHKRVGFSLGKPITAALQNILGLSCARANHGSACPCVWRIVAHHPAYERHPLPSLHPQEACRAQASCGVAPEQILGIHFNSQSRAAHRSRETVHNRITTLPHGRTGKNVPQPHTTIGQFGIRFKQNRCLSFKLVLLRCLHLRLRLG